MIASGELIAVTLFVGVFALIIVVIWQTFATVRARAQVAREQQYRELAERSTRTVEHVDQTLTDIQQRIQWMEKAMREVQ